MLPHRQRSADLISLLLIARSNVCLGAVNLYMSKPATPLATPTAGDAAAQHEASWNDIGAAPASAGGLKPAAVQLDKHDQAGGDAVAVANARRLQRATDLANAHVPDSRHDEHESDPAATAREILELAALHPNNICLSSFDPALFGQLPPSEREELLRCMRTGIDDPAAAGAGCSAVHANDYDRFQPFFRAVLAKLRGAEFVLQDRSEKQPSGWCSSNGVGIGALDISDLDLPAVQIACTARRNLKDLPMSISGETDEGNQTRSSLESRALKIFDSLPSMGGRYLSFTPGHANFISEPDFQALDTVWMMNASFPAADLAYGEGCGLYFDMDQGNQPVSIKVGGQDHFEIVCIQHGTILNEPLERIKSTVETISSIEGAEFAISAALGVVTASPVHVGTA